LLGLHAAAPIAAAAGFATVEAILLRGVDARVRVLVSVIVLLMLQVLMLWVLMLRVLVRRTVATATAATAWSGTGQLGASAISHGDEQSSYVFAVLSCLLERRTGAVGGDAFAAEPNRHGVGVGIRAADFAQRDRFVDIDVFDDFALFVVEAAQKGAGAEQSAQAAIRQGGERVS
jgi:hypothetical protein